MPNVVQFPRDGDPESSGTLEVLFHTKHRRWSNMSGPGSGRMSMPRILLNPRF